jgi:hypothetical protein
VGSEGSPKRRRQRKPLRAALYVVAGSHGPLKTMFASPPSTRRELHSHANRDEKQNRGRDDSQSIDLQKSHVLKQILKSGIHKDSLCCRSGQPRDFSISGLKPMIDRTLSGAMKAFPPSQPFLE